MLPSLNILLFIKNKKKKLPYNPYKEKKGLCGYTVLRFCGFAVLRFGEAINKQKKDRIDKSTNRQIDKSTNYVNKCEKISKRDLFPLSGRVVVGRNASAGC